jgi:hypothetical protein
MSTLTSRDVLPIVRPAEDLAAVESAVKEAHAEVTKHSRASVEAARRAGEQLAKVQNRLKAEHRWTRWLAEIGLPRATAQNYLIIHQRWAECTTVVHLGVAGVLEHLRAVGTDGGRKVRPGPPRPGAATPPPGSEAETSPPDLVRVRLTVVLDLQADALPALRGAVGGGDVWVAKLASADKLWLPARTVVEAVEDVTCS